MSDFERYVEVHQITETRDGSIFRTKFLRNEWIDSDIFHHPPTGTGIVYYYAIPPEDDPTGMGLRRKRTQ